MKKLINDILKPTGYKFSSIVSKYDRLKYKWLTEYNIKSIIDVGANEGQFALDITKTLNMAKVYSFEPLKETFEILQSHIAPFANMRCFNMALGDSNGQTKIYKNEYTPSSSILELGDKHLEAYPESNKVSFEEITIGKLDDFLNETALELEDNILLKIDVQGFEDKVILGASESLKKIKVVFVEVSFWELYKNQSLFDNIYSLLNTLGFKYRGNYDVSYNKDNGLPIFADAIFIR
jgi:FkbM family methyltransferase